jgi:hypothetical protein
MFIVIKIFLKEFGKMIWSRWDLIDFTMEINLKVNFVIMRYFMVLWSMQMEIYIKDSSRIIRETVTENIFL